MLLQRYERLRKICCWPASWLSYSRSIVEWTTSELMLLSNGCWIGAGKHLPRLLLAAERSVQTGLPFSTPIESALLIAGTETPGSWRVLDTLPLGGDRTVTT